MLHLYSMFLTWLQGCYTCTQGRRTQWTFGLRGDRHLSSAVVTLCLRDASPWTQKLLYSFIDGMFTTSTLLILSSISFSGIFRIYLLFARQRQLFRTITQNTMGSNLVYFESFPSVHFECISGFCILQSVLCYLSFAIIVFHDTDSITLYSELYTLFPLSVFNISGRCVFP